MSKHAETLSLPLGPELELSLNRSLLEGFCDCHRFFFCELHKERGLSRGPALRGTIDHEICEDYVQHLVRTGEKTDLAELSRITASVLAFWPGVDEAMREEVTSDMDLFGSSVVIPTAGIVGIEKSLQVQVDANTIVYGTPDLARVVDGVGYVLDYKSQWKLMTEAECQKAFQFLCYAWMLCVEHDLTSVEVDVVFIKHQVTRHLVYEREQLDEFWSRIKGIIGAIRACPTADPCPGSRCQYCDHVEGCPMPDVVPYTLPDAMRVAGNVLRLEARLKDEKEKLQSFCTANGFVVVDDQQFGYHTSKTLNYPANDLIGVLGLTPALPFLKVEGEKVRTKKFQKQWGTNLKGFEVYTTSQRFGHRKAGEEDE